MQRLGAPSPPRSGGKGRGENSPKPIARLEPLNRNNDRGSVSLSSPKGGEGWGEEALGFKGNLIGCSALNVRCSMFPVHGEGISHQNEGVTTSLQNVADEFDHHFVSHSEDRPKLPGFFARGRVKFFCAMQRSARFLHPCLSQKRSPLALRR